MAVLSFLVPLALILGGAELLVRGASRLAVSWGISPLVVGLTVVAFGTSSPELAIAIGSVIGGESDLAVGNVVGSNIANVLLILGLSAALAPLVVRSQLVRFDVPVMIAASVLVLLFSLDGVIGAVDGVALVAALAIYLVVLIRRSRRETPDVVDQFGQEYGDVPPSPVRNISLALAGLALLVVGSNLLVDAAVALAEQIGVSQLVIGLTVVAVGTSLPEIATSLVALARGARDIAVGTAIGSNIFNLLAVLGITGLVAPQGVSVAQGVLDFDLPVMVVVAAACIPIFFTGHRIVRWEGVLFLGYYFAYTVYLFLRATEHDAVEPFSTTMIWFVVPLTVLTISATVIRARRNLQ